MAGAGAGEPVGGRYRLREEIGAGGMGVVWRAADEMLGREVALKRVRVDLFDPATADEMRRRTLREARIAAQLHHPNVVSIFDVLIVDGDPWLVLEYLPSESLAARLAARGPLTPAEAAGIGAAVADALAAAHAARVTHRDVKPGNVLLGRAGPVKLTDFGISHATGDVTLTRTGLVTGTPAYLAPEVARGGHGDAAADVYSLGGTLYAAVEGAPPFAAGPGQPDALRVLRLVATTPPPAPRRAGPLTGVLSRLMSLDPARRPSATEAARLLREVAAQDPGPPHPPAPPVPGAGPPPSGWPHHRPTAAGPPHPAVGRLPYGAPEQPRSGVAGRTGWIVAGAAVTALVITAGVLLGLQVRPDPEPPLPTATPGPTPTTAAGSPVLGPDPRTADPCSLVDPTPLRTLGTAEVDVDFGGFAACQMTMFPTVGGSVLVTAEFFPTLPPNDALPGAVEVRGDLAIGRTTGSTTYCERTLLLADRTQVVISADGREGTTADLCAVADTATETAVTRVTTSGIGRRSLTDAPNSLVTVDACALLDATALAAVPGLGATAGVPRFGNWTCVWGSGDTRVQLFLSRQGAFADGDGTATTLAGRDTRVLAGGYANLSGCLVQVPGRSFVAANGQQRVEKTQILYDGAGTTEEQCAVATRLMETVIPRLPPA